MKNNIKVVGIDVYGTILATEDPENLLGPRKGFNELIKKLKTQKIQIVTTSDADLTNLKIDLKENKIDPNIFYDMYELKTDPKDYTWILRDFKIKSKELLIIGDTDKDIEGAQRIRARYIRVPQRIGIGDEYSLENIIPIL